MNNLFRRLLAGTLAVLITFTTIPAFGVSETPDPDNSSSFISNIQISDKTIIQNTCGWENVSYDENGEEFYWYQYSPYDIVGPYTIETIYGEVIYGEGEVFFYNGEPYWLDIYHGQSEESPWGLGTHEVYISVDGYSTSFNVEIIDSPVRSMTVYTDPIVQGTKGYFAWETVYTDTTWEEVSWYRYDEYQMIRDCVVELDDGSVIYNAHNGIEYNGKWHSLSATSYQSYNEQWGLGEHTMDISLLGYNTSVTIEVVDSPIASIEFEPIEIIEKTHGEMVTSGVYTETGYEEINWYRYYEHAVIGSYHVTMKNGDEVEGWGSSFNYGDQYYDISIYSDQSQHNQWGLGSNYMTIEVAGYRTEVEVIINESPVESIFLFSQDILKNTQGEYLTSYVYDGHSYVEKQWYRYNEYDLVGEFHIYLKNGEFIQGWGSGFEYNGEYYNFDIQTNQNPNNPWDAGLNEFRVCVLGYETTGSVNIVESPFESITMEPITVTAYTKGYFEEYWGENPGEHDRWYRYSEYNLLGDFEIKLKSGEVIKGNGGWFEYAGDGYQLSYSSDQSYHNQWGLGKHEMIVSIGDIETTVEVNVVPSKYTAIEVYEVGELTEGIDGSFSEYTGRFEYDNPKVSLKMTDKDGNTYIYYNISNEYMTREGSEWGPGNDNELTITFEGTTLKTNVVINPAISNNFDAYGENYRYFVQDGEVYITAIYTSSKEYTVPEMINGYPVKGIVSLDNWEIEHLIVPDSVEVFVGSEWNDSLRTITLGSGIVNLDDRTFENYQSLENIYVSEDNPYFTSINGIVYDKNLEYVVSFPPAKSGDIIIPKTVINMDAVFTYATGDLNIFFEAGSEGFVVVDNVVYTADMSKVVYCLKDKTGKYVMPDSVTEIAYGAFKDCTSLTDITVSKNVTTIVYEAFANCSALENISLPNRVTAIDMAAFRHCENLRAIDLPDNLEVVGDMAFQDAGLTSLILPEGTMYIGNSAFASNNIVSLSVPNSVYELGDNSFGYNGDLKSVVLGSGISRINNGTFIFCNNLETVELLNECVEIGDRAFAYTGLKSINFENVAGTMGRFAFEGTEIETLVVPASVTEISYATFKNCESLSKIEVPTSVQTLDGHAFDGTAWYQAQQDGVTYLDTILYDYKGVMPADTEVVVKEGTTMIAALAFEEECALTKIVLNEGLVSIGEGAFACCENLKEIDIPSTVSHIGYYAFERCYGLEAVNVHPNNPYYTSLNGVLYSKDMKELIWCPKQDTDTFVVPLSVSTIRYDAFQHSGVDYVTVLNKNTTIEDRWYADRNDESEHGFGQIDGDQFQFVCYEDSRIAEYARENELLIQLLDECSHVWDSEPTIDKEPTCTEEGYQSIHCSACGGRKDIEVIDPLPHNVTKVEASEPKITLPGNVEHWKCDCGAYFLDEECTNIVYDRDEIFIRSLGQVYLDVNIGKVAVRVYEEIVDDVLLESISSGSDEVVLDVIGGDVVKWVELPVAALDKVAKADKSLTIEAPCATLTLDHEALEDVVAKANEEAVFIKIDSVSDPESETSVFVEIACKESGEVISGSLGNGNATLKIPFQFGEDESVKNYEVVRLDDYGNTEYMTFDYADGYVGVTTKQLGEFVVVKASGDAPAGLTGDVNGDGVVDTIDASAVISYYYGNIDFDDNQMRLADVNGDGEINTIDASTIISYYYGNIDSFEQ